MQIWVQHRLVNDVHIYTTFDSLLTGFCVASTEQEIAWQQARSQIRRMLLDNHDLNIIDQNLILRSEEAEDAINPGTMVVLDAIPPKLIEGLPEADQAAILAIAGQPVKLGGYSYGEAVLDFTDSQGHGHTIWVERFLIKRVKPGL